MLKWYLKSGLLMVLLLVAVSILIQPVQAFEVKLSGQVNQLIMWTDNGNASDFFIADNDNSSTRFRFTGTETFGKVDTGFKIELEAQRNATDTLDIPNTGDGDFEFNDRWLEVYFEGVYGKISIGKGSGAADNTSETDLSGTAVIMYAAVNDTTADFTWTFDNGTKIVRNGVNLAVGDTRSNFDGLSRNERVRYDSPKFAGFSLAGSITNGDAWEVSGWYTGDFDALGKLAASIGYVDSNDRSPLTYTQWGGSVSWLHPIGINVTLSLGQRDTDGDTNADNGYAKVGYKFGMHAVAVEYGQTSDLDQKGDTSDNLGAAYVVNPWSGIEFYAAVRSFSFEQYGPNPENINQIMTGTRIKF
jgi:hypothetical protein